LTTPPISGGRHASEDMNRPTPAPEEQTRQWLLDRLREIMEIAMQRVTNPKTPTSDRIKWSRIAIGAGQACNAVLRDVEINALKQQINELKQLTLSKLSEDEDADANEH
jgi:hypothetical protein